ncbi:MAG: UDP-3-O-(3-hydroxymyristoyl)glucosamine N-acyltransferase, partial [Massilibacteroides sp.]|nr:UDP-3-O-(3-hydroxymyristoyl)glucosamine N-acyltransferase [Massilibacteroides sp.]
MEFSAQQIADFLKGSVDGNPDVKVHDFSKIEEGKPGTLTFLANPKYEHHIYKTKASLVLVNTDFKPSEPITATLVRVENAYASLAMLLKLVDQSKERKIGINELAFISEKATVGEDVYIGAFAFIGEGARIGNNCQIYPHVYIGDNVTIGDNCIIYPQVTIYHDCKVGDTCIFHAGSVIGSDGFGFAPMGERYDKIPQLGNVMIENDVELGANTTVDRAVMGS